MQIIEGNKKHNELYLHIFEISGGVCGLILYYIFIYITCNIFLYAFVIL